MWLNSHDRKWLNFKRPLTNVVKWTVDKLKKAYNELTDNELGCKLQKILNWAVDKEVFKITIAMFPAFGLQGKSKERIISFFSDGYIYAYLNEKHYPAGAEERNELVGKLKELRFLDQDLDLSKSFLDGIW